MRRAVFAALLVAAGTLSSCRRAPLPDPGTKREVVSGVPVSFGPQDEGAPAFTWEFGDGSPAVKASRVDHAFARAGEYAVVARLGDEELVRIPVTVRPRSVLEAVPPSATTIVFIPSTRDALAPAVDFFEGAVGGLVGPGAVERDPFLRYALELSAGPPPEELGLDPDEGLAAFELPDVRGFVVTIGVADEQRALAAARRLFEQSGYEALTTDAGLELVDGAGRQLTAFVDRGYLYFVPFAGDTPLDRRDARPFLRAVRAMAPGGGAATSELQALKARVADGQAFFFAKSTRQHRLRAVMASLSFTAQQLTIDAFLDSAGPLWNAEQAAFGQALESAPAGPAFAASLSMDPPNLAALLTELPGMDAALQGGLERTPDASKPGTPPPPADEATARLARVVRGDLAFAAWFDAPATMARMARSRGAPSFSGTLLLQAGIVDRTAAEALVATLLTNQGFQTKVRPAFDATTFVFSVEGRPSIVEITERVLTVQIGEALRDRPAAPLRQELQHRFDEAAFSRGHASFMADLGQLARELSAPGATTGEDESDELLKGFVTAFIQQATAIDTAFVDVTPEPDGARLSGKVTLRAR